MLIKIYEETYDEMEVHYKITDFLAYMFTMPNIEKVDLLCPEFLALKMMRLSETHREEIESFAMAQIAYQSNSFKLTLEEIKNNIFENFIGCELV